MRAVEHSKNLTEAKNTLQLFYSLSIPKKQIFLKASVEEFISHFSTPSHVSQRWSIQDRIQGEEPLSESFNAHDPVF